MELLLAIAIGTLVAAGVWLVLRDSTFTVLLGLALLGYGVNLLLFASGRLVTGSAPLADLARRDHPDPIPQALVLTAIVIGFAMTAFLAALAIRSRSVHGGEHVDGEPPP